MNHKPPKRSSISASFSPNRLHLIWCFGLLIFTLQISKAQTDPQFTQNKANILSYNPAAAGFKPKTNLFGLYRQQWVGLEGAPETMVFNLDMPITIFKKQSGVGLSIVNDKLGLLRNLTINFLYSYRKKLWNGTLGAGIRAGIVNSDFDGSGIKSPTEGVFHQITKTAKSSKSVFDAGLGLYFENKDFYAGLSATHLFQPTITLVDLGDVYFLKRNLYALLGYKHTLNNKKYVLEPSVFYKRDGIVGQIDINLILTYNNNFWGGFDIRPNDAIAALFGLKLKNGVEFTYAYDITVSKLGYSTWGSHEISVHYAFDLIIGKKQNKYKSIRIL